MKYAIIMKMTWNGLEDEVNRWIKAGWIPLGAPFESNHSCRQAMIEKEK